MRSSALAAARASSRVSVRSVATPANSSPDDFRTRARLMDTNRCWTARRFGAYFRELVWRACWIGLRQRGPDLGSRSGFLFSAELSYRLTEMPPAGLLVQAGAPASPRDRAPQGKRGNHQSSRVHSGPRCTCCSLRLPNNRTACPGKGTLGLPRTCERRQGFFNAPAFSAAAM